MTTPHSSEVSLERLAAHALAIATAASTFVLLASGGLVTSHGVGMAVPDWPTTFGYNMFAFPISRWVGGVLYEHTHRLIASGVGLLMVLTSVVTFAVEPRRWVKAMAAWLTIGVVLQGVLGGLRVTLIKDQIGIFHALLAQAFFAGATIFAVATSPAYVRGAWRTGPAAERLRGVTAAATLCVFVQLAIAATMRHAHAGLSIPDFPLAYGAIVPRTDAATLEAINAARVAGGEMRTSGFLIWLQMAHRAVALVIVAMVGWGCHRAFRTPGMPGFVRYGYAAWAAMIAAQIVLGAWTIWSNKAADIATLHMALGALALDLGAVLAFRCHCAGADVRARNTPPPDRPPHSGSPGKTSHEGVAISD